MSFSLQTNSLGATVNVPSTAKGMPVGGFDTSGGGTFSLTTGDAGGLVTNDDATNGSGNQVARLASVQAQTSAGTVSFSVDNPNSRSGTLWGLNVPNPDVATPLSYILGLLHAFWLW